MALLVNRKYGSRLECLYYILKSRYAKFGKDTCFSLTDFQFDETDIYNVHHYCPLLIDCIGNLCCPYLVNPLSSSKCYATQSINNDSTKSKAVSDIGGSLEALGFIEKRDGGYVITDTGEQWVQTDFGTYQWENVALEGVISYGVVIGFLNKIRTRDDEFSCSGIYLGYPRTSEFVEYINTNGENRRISLSTGSQADSNTRTVSHIIAWCVAVGLIEPVITEFDRTTDIPYLKYRDFLHSKRLTVRKFRKTDLCNEILQTKRIVRNPLSYTRLHKNVASLRENGGADLRECTMKYNSNILNRRYVFIKMLNWCSKNSVNLSFSKLVDVMEVYKSYFFSHGNNASDIMASEIEIADIVGIPFDVNGDEMIPLTIVNEDVLDYNVDISICNLADSIIDEVRNLT